MTQVEQILERELDRALQAAREWRTETGPLSPVIQRHLLAARAEQIREIMSLVCRASDHVDLSALADGLEKIGGIA